MKFSIRDLLWLTVVVAVALVGAINYYRLLEKHERLLNEQLALTRKLQLLQTNVAPRGASRAPVIVPERTINDMYPQLPGPPRPRLNDVLLDFQAIDPSDA